MFSLPYVILCTFILSPINHLCCKLNFPHLFSLALLSNAVKSMQAGWFQMITFSVHFIRVYLVSRITICETFSWMFISECLERYFTWVVPAIIVAKRTMMLPMYLQWPNLKMSTSVHLIIWHLILSSKFQMSVF